MSLLLIHLAQDSAMKNVSRILQTYIDLIFYVVGSARILQTYIDLIFYVVGSARNCLIHEIV